MRRINTFDAMMVGAWMGIAICLLMVYFYQCRVNYLKSIEQEPIFRHDCCHPVEMVKTT